MGSEMCIRDRRLGCHCWAQIRAADANVDNLLNRTAGMPKPRAGAKRGSKITHSAQHVVHISRDILAINLQILVGGHTQRGVQHCAVLSGVEVGAGKHGVDKQGKLRIMCQITQLLHNLRINQVLRKINPQTCSVKRQLASAIRVLSEQLTQREVGLCSVQGFKGIPAWGGGDISHTFQGREFPRIMGAMSIVKINAISLPDNVPGAGEELERRFAARKHAIDTQPGFEGFQLLRPAKGEDRYFVVTRWADEESYRAWWAGQGRASHGSTKGEDGQERKPVSQKAELLEFEVVLDSLEP